jgi:hypothetical protein
MQLQKRNRDAKPLPSVRKTQGRTVSDGQSHPTMLRRPSELAAMYAKLRSNPGADWTFTSNTGSNKTRLSRRSATDDLPNDACKVP